MSKKQWGGPKPEARMTESGGRVHGEGTESPLPTSYRGSGEPTAYGAFLLLKKHVYSIHVWYIMNALELTKYKQVVWPSQLQPTRYMPCAITQLHKVFIAGHGS